MQNTKPTADEAPKSFEASRQETLECGFLLACYQTLILAMRDRRLHYKHRAVLAVLIEHMNRNSGMTWVGRERIATLLGLAATTVSNTLNDLKTLGYIQAENRRTPETNNRSLRHYTLAGLSKAEIERMLADALSAIKTRGPIEVTADHASKVTARSDSESHRPQCLSVGVGARKSPPVVDESHRPQWTVTSDIELKKKKEEEALLSQTSVVVFRSDPVFADTDECSFHELARLGVHQPSDAQVLRMRSEIVGCIDSHVAKGKSGTARAWFQSKWVTQPWFKDAIAKAATETHATGNSFVDTVERRLAQTGGAQ